MTSVYVSLCLLFELLGGQVLNSCLVVEEARLPTLIQLCRVLNLKQRSQPSSSKNLISNVLKNFSIHAKKQKE